MNNEEMLSKILETIYSMKSDMETMKLDLVNVKSDMETMKSDIDSRLDRVESQMEYMNGKINLINEKVDDLKVDVKFSQKVLQKDIKKLNDATDTVVTVLEHKGILQAN